MGVSHDFASSAMIGWEGGGMGGWGGVGGGGDLMIYSDSCHMFCERRNEGCLWISGKSFTVLLLASILQLICIFVYNNEFPCFTMLRS